MLESMAAYQLKTQVLFSILLPFPVYTCFSSPSLTPTHPLLTSIKCRTEAEVSRLVTDNISIKFDYLGSATVSQEQFSYQVYTIYLLYVCMYVSMYICMYECMHMYVCTCMYVCMYCMYMYVCMPSCTSSSSSRSLPSTILRLCQAGVHSQVAPTSQYEGATLALVALTMSPSPATSAGYMRSCETMRPFWIKYAKLTLPYVRAHTHTHTHHTPQARQHYV